MKIIGLDPSLRGFGVSDGERHIVIGTRSGWDLDERIDALIDGIDDFIDQRAGDALMLVVEAPNLGAMRQAAGDDRPPPGSHLYEIGALMRALRAELVPALREGASVIYLEVQVSTLRRHIVGNGNAAKENLPYMVEQIWNQTFQDDRGVDKLIAWSCWKYGVAVHAGEIEHVFAAARGQGRTARFNRRKAERARAKAAAVA